MKGKRLFPTSAIVCLLLMAGCKTKTAVEYRNRVVTELRVDTLIRTDSVAVHDSVAVYMRADTVFIEKWREKTALRYVYRNRVDTVLRTDSVRVPVATELTKTQRRLMAMGRVSVGIVGLMGLMGVIWLIWKVKK